MCIIILYVSITSKVYSCIVNSFVCVFFDCFFADVAKLADALDLGSKAARRGGSSPSIRTTIKVDQLL